jgi:hypothetical protein
MTIPSGAYAVTYRVSLHDHTGVDPVDIAIETTFLFSVSSGISPSPVVIAEDAAAEAAMRAWKTSVETSFPNASSGSASREYLLKASGNAWPS